MMSGQLRSAVERSAEAKRASVAHSEVIRHLGGACLTKEVSETALQQFADTLVPREAVAFGEAAFEEHAAALQHSAHLLALEDGDPERAVKAGKDVIVDFVEAEYRAATTTEVQSQLAQQFEAATTPKNHQAGGS